MESHPQNPEFRNNPENFYQCIGKQKLCGLAYITALYEPPGHHLLMIISA